MNKVICIGRMTADPELRESNSGTSYIRFSLAVDREGKDKGADFPNCIIFGKTAEILNRYGHKGKQIAIEGRLQTGSYDKDGVKIYTTDVVVDRLTLLGSAEKKEEPKEEFDPYDLF